MTTSPPPIPVLGLHHHEWVVDDQERTRAFYEGVIGLPLVATWIEDVAVEDARIQYIHTQYGLADGSALSFFSFADPDDQSRFAGCPQSSPFAHLALAVTPEAQQAIAERFSTSEAETGPSYTLDHGYCTSLYLTDPDGLVLEFTADSPAAAETRSQRRRTASVDLQRWHAGDRRGNNPLRPRG